MSNTNSENLDRFESSQDVSGFENETSDEFQQQNFKIDSPSELPTKLKQLEADGFENIGCDAVSGDLLFSNGNEGQEPTAVNIDDGVREGLQDAAEAAREDIPEIIADVQEFQESGSPTALKSAYVKATAFACLLASAGVLSGCSGDWEGAGKEGVDVFSILFNGVDHGAPALLKFIFWIIEAGIFTFPYLYIGGEAYFAHHKGKFPSHTRTLGRNIKRLGESETVEDRVRSRVNRLKTTISTVNPSSKKLKAAVSNLITVVDSTFEPIIARHLTSGALSETDVNNVLTTLEQCVANIASTTSGVTIKSEIQNFISACNAVPTPGRPVYTRHPIKKYLLPVGLGLLLSSASMCSTPDKPEDEKPKQEQQENNSGGNKDDVNVD